MTMRRCATPLAVALLALALAGCGSSSLSATQLRAGAARICAGAQRRAVRIPTPTLPSGEAMYLGRGVAALTPELVQLRTLRPPGNLAAQYRNALAAAAGELRALRSTLRGLRAGNDPVVAIKTLQQELKPLEDRSVRAWEAVSVPSCINPNS